MFIQQFFVKGISHSSYLLGGTNTCAIIDPQRDVEIYIDAAKEMGMNITHILETHLHADFISGHLDLADRTGAAVYAPRAGRCAFRHRPLSEDGAGSLCGRALGAMRTGTVGYELQHNSALLIKDKKAFVASLTGNMPPAPDHFSRCSAINGRGPALLKNLPATAPLAPDAFRKRARRKKTAILDIRHADAFGGQHIPGALHIDLSMNFSTFCGWVIPPDAEMLLVAESPEQVFEAVTQLRRVGLDKAAGYLDGGMYAWARAALPLDHVPQLSVAELHKKIQSRHHMALVDVRTRREYEAGHITGSISIPVPELRTRFGEISARHPVAVICNTGQRSSLGTSILMQHGFSNVVNVAGGMTAYGAAGYAPECPVCINTHGPQTEFPGS